MIRKLSLLAVCSLFGSAAVAGAVLDLQNNFKAALSGAQEVPVVSTLGQGSFAATLAVDEMSFELRYAMLDGSPVAAHIHLGDKFTSGGVIAHLCGGGGKPACPASPGIVTGKITPDDITGPANQGIDPGQFAELVRAAKAGLVYVNVHTDRFPGGEIRGTVLKRIGRPNSDR